MTVWTTKVQFSFLWTDLNNFSSSLTWKFDGDSDIVLSLKSLSDHKCPIFLFMDRLQYFFSFFDLEIRWEFQIRYCTFPQMTNWTTKVQFLLICCTSLLMNVVILVYFIFRYKKGGDSVLSMQYTGNRRIFAFSFIFECGFFLRLC